MAEILHGGWKLVEFLNYQNKIPLGVQLFGSFQTSASGKWRPIVFNVLR